MSIPLILSTNYTVSNNYTATINPLLSGTMPYYISTDGYDTSIYKNPIRTFISPLGTALDSDQYITNIPLKYHKNKLESDLDPDSPTLSFYNPPNVLIPNTIKYDSAELRKDMTKYFFEKTMNDWLSDDFSDLLKELKVKGDKIEYIAENIMTKYDMKTFLKKFVNKSGINWLDLRRNKSKVKRSIYKKLQSRISKK